MELDNFSVVSGEMGRLSPILSITLATEDSGRGLSD